MYKYSLLNTKTSNPLWKKTMEPKNVKTGESYNGENWGTLAGEQNNKKI